MKTFFCRFAGFVLLNLMMLLPITVLGVAAASARSGHPSLSYTTLYGIFAVGSLLLLAWVCLRKRRFGGWQHRYRLPGAGAASGIALGYFVLLLCLGPLYEWLLQLFGWGSINDLENQRLLAELLAKMPFLMSLHIVVYAPLAEELLYRGVLFQDLFGSSGGKTAALLPVAASALIFALMHSSINHPGFLLYFLMGCIFGLVYLHTGRLRYAVAVHIANNLLSGWLLLDSMSLL